MREHGDRDNEWVREGECRVWELLPSTTGLPASLHRTALNITFKDVAVWFCTVTAQELVVLHFIRKRGVWSAISGHHRLESSHPAAAVELSRCFSSDFSYLNTVSQVADSPNSS